MVGLHQISSNMNLCTIVGVGEGMGLALAQRFGKGGCRIAMISREQAALDGYAERLGKHGVRATGYAADAGNAGVLEAAFERLHKELGPTNILIYNASIFRQALPSQLAAADLISDLRVNVAGALVATQAVLPGMKAAKAGTVLFTGGGSALEPFPSGASLGVGKAGLRNLALSLAGEFEPLGIHVATVTISGNIAPGTHFDPATIAEEFWHLHQQPHGQWQREVVYK